MSGEGKELSRGKLSSSRGKKEFEPGEKSSSRGKEFKPGIRVQVGRGGESRGETGFELGGEISNGVEGRAEVLHHNNHASSNDLEMRFSMVRHAIIAQVEYCNCILQNCTIVFCI